MLPFSFSFGSLSLSVSLYASGLPYCRTAGLLDTRTLGWVGQFMHSICSAPVWSGLPWSWSWPELSYKSHWLILIFALSVWIRVGFCIAHRHTHSPNTHTLPHTFILTSKCKLTFTVLLHQKAAIHGPFFALLSPPLLPPSPLIAPLLPCTLSPTPVHGNGN